MRYKPEHKQATRDRIIAAASRLFRRHGYAATGVDAVMAEAGLTAGCFYAHFVSKEALLVETLTKCLGEGAEKVARTATATSEPFGAIVSRYLCSGHRDDPGDGCPLPTLAVEVSRLGLGARRGFTRALERYLTHVESFVPGALPSKRRERSLAMLSTLVGAMVLARAVTDEALSEAIFDSARRVLLATTRPSSPASKASRKKKQRKRVALLRH